MWTPPATYSAINFAEAGLNVTDPAIFVVGSAMIDGVGRLHWLVGILPVHYWMRWTQPFEHGDNVAVAVGGLVQVAWIVLATGRRAAPRNAS